MGKLPATILVVTDESLLTDFCTDILSQQGYAVECVEPSDSQVRVAAGGIDLVLLDMGWPETSGLKLCQQIRAQPAAQHVAIVGLTDLPDASQEVTGFAFGPDEYLSKPFAIYDLLATVNRYCSPQD